jgi:hypothetical protein
VLEPLLRLASFLCIADYRDYIGASEADPKIELFLEVSNIYSA